MDALILPTTVRGSLGVGVPIPTFLFLGALPIVPLLFAEKLNPGIDSVPPLDGFNSIVSPTIEPPDI